MHARIFLFSLSLPGCVPSLAIFASVDDKTLIDTTSAPETLTDTATETQSAPDTGGTSDTDGTSDTGVEAPSFTLLSLNLHCFLLDGTSFISNDDRLDTIAEEVAAVGADAIAVQEACVNDAEGSAIERLAAALATASGTSWGSVWAETHPAWTGTPDEAIEGVGILVRAGEPVDPVELLYAVQGSQSRKALAATVTSPSGVSVRLYTVHLEHDDASARRAQARETATHALVHADPSTWATLVAGDFNALAADEPMIDVMGVGFARLSTASDPSGIEIDHIFAPTAAGFEMNASHLLFDGISGPVVSDHPGVLVRLALGAPLPAVVTRLSATHDAGFGHYLAIRGDTAPLSWDLGWPAANTASDRWEAAFLDFPAGSIAYKWLRDDTEWETGDDHLAEVGLTSEVTPAF